MTTRPEKPIGIVIIAWASIVVGAVDVLASIVTAIRGGEFAIYAPLMFTLGAIVFGLGFAFRTFQRWALYLLVAYLGVLALAGLLSSEHRLAGLIAAAVVAYLCTPKVRRAFSTSRAVAQEPEEANAPGSQPALFRGLPASSKIRWWPEWLPTKSVVALMAVALCAVAFSFWVIRRFSITGTWTFSEQDSGQAYITFLHITRIGEGNYKLMETLAGPAPLPFSYELQLEQRGYQLYVGTGRLEGAGDQFFATLKLENGTLTCQCGFPLGTWTARRP